MKKIILSIWLLSMFGFVSAHDVDHEVGRSWTVAKYATVTEDHMYAINDFLINKINEITWLSNTFYIVFDNTKKGRAYASSERIIYNLDRIKSKREAMIVTLHEIWHIVSLNMETWSETISSVYTHGWKPRRDIFNPLLDFARISRDWEKTIRKWLEYNDFCSWYWMSDFYEDRSECFVLYMMHNDLFVAKTEISDTMRKKYEYFDWLMKWTYFRKWDKTRLTGNIYDTTKIDW